MRELVRASFYETRFYGNDKQKKNIAFLFFCHFF